MTNAHRKYSLMVAMIGLSYWKCLSSVSIDSIKLDDSNVSLYISNKAITGSITVSEYAPYNLSTTISTVSGISNNGQSAQVVSISRLSGSRDRSYSAFKISLPGDASSQKFATIFNFSGADPTEFPTSCSKKGLQMMIGAPTDDQELSIQHMTVNAECSMYAKSTQDNPNGYSTPFSIDGSVYYFNNSLLSSLDNDVNSSRSVGAIVYMVIYYIASNYNEPFSSTPDPLRHPLCPNPTPSDNSVTVCATNTTNSSGIKKYKAVVEYLANRYKGKVFGFIIGNETDLHWTWNNMGTPQPSGVVSDYSKTIRVAYTAVRKYSKNARIYVSLAHHWNEEGEFPGQNKSAAGRYILDNLNSTIQGQGDINWSLAYHPYPNYDATFIGTSNGGYGGTWNDNIGPLGFSTTDQNTTPRITPWNLHLIRDYLMQSQFLYKGKQRSIILSEQGIWTTNPTDIDQQNRQAAALAYLYYKAQNLRGIDAEVYFHRKDYIPTGGTCSTLGSSCFGLRMADDSKKNSYDLYHFGDRLEWRKLFNQYLVIIQNNGRPNFTSWDMAMEGQQSSGSTLCKDPLTGSILTPLMLSR